MLTALNITTTPSSLKKAREQAKGNPKKMRNPMAPKTASTSQPCLRRSFELQKQGFTPVFSVSGANVLNKAKNKQNEA